MWWQLLFSKGKKGSQSRHRLDTKRWSMDTSVYINKRMATTSVQQTHSNMSSLWHDGNKSRASRQDPSSAFKVEGIVITFGILNFPSYYGMCYASTDFLAFGWVTCRGLDCFFNLSILIFKSHTWYECFHFYFDNDYNNMFN